MSDFAQFPKETRQFYNQIVYLSLLNLAAVKRGMFDTVLCEVEDDELCLFAWFRFCEQIPVLKLALGLRPPVE